MVKSSHLTIANIPVQVTRKKIKNLHLAVYPPEGQVRVSVPLRVSDEQIRLMVLSRLNWIHQQQTRFANQPRQTAREYVTGESHYFQGQRYLLEVVATTGKHRVELNGNRQLRLFISPQTSTENRAKLLAAWYRIQLKLSIDNLLSKWQPIIAKPVNSYDIRQMKTRWGSCNPRTAQILLNLELAKKPLACLEYVLVHELVHLHEASHNARFYQLVGHYLPDWQARREILNLQPLAHDLNDEY